MVLINETKPFSFEEHRMGAAQQRVLAAQSQGFLYRFELTVLLGISSKEKIHSIANQRPIELQVLISSEKVIYMITSRNL